jgi:hypothetical protein
MRLEVASDTYYCPDVLVVCDRIELPTVSEPAPEEYDAGHSDPFDPDDADG